MNFIDHYITNPMCEYTSIELTCPECNEVWTVEGIKEFGHWSATNEDDMFCHRCAIAGEQ